MTTPPAGWYPDPDGSGGQRYWDGSAWTEQRSGGTPAPPSFGGGAEQPTGGQGGAHRRPEPEPEVPPQAFGSTEMPPQAFGSTDFPPQGSGARDVPPSGYEMTDASSQAFGTTDVPPQGSPDAPGGDGHRRLVTTYVAACAGLLVLLIAAVVYGFVIRKDTPIELTSPDTATSAAATTTESTTTTQETETTTESPTTASAVGGTAIDGPLSFEVLGVEVGDTVVAADSGAEKTAQGQYTVVHLTVTNTGEDSTSFIGMYQKLLAGGQSFDIDDEATAYLGGTFADLEPGDSANVSVAFDVPAGTEAEFVELHADPTTPGAQMPLS